MKFLLVDDHVIVRKSLLRIISTEYPEASCIECQNGQSCINELKKGKFDLVILDMNLPDMDGMTLAEWILDKDPSQEILFFSTSPTDVYAKRLYQLGIRGYVNKQEEIVVISKALSVILKEKKPYYGEEFTSLLARDFLSGSKPNLFEKLTPRELSIAQLLAHGKTYNEISAQLNIESSTIRSYKARIYQKLEVESVLDFLNKVKAYKLIG